MGEMGGWNGKGVYSYGGFLWGREERYSRFDGRLLCFTYKCIGAWSLNCWLIVRYTLTCHLHPVRIKHWLFYYEHGAEVRLVKLASRIELAVRQLEPRDFARQSSLSTSTSFEDFA